MLTLLGSLFGFISSTFPAILKFYQNKQNHSHELALGNQQMEHLRLDASQRLKEIGAQADIAEGKALYQHDAQLSGGSFIDSLRASVRPVITYAFFLLFSSIKLSALYLLITQQGLELDSALTQIWDAETQALFAAVMSFWFGQRALLKIRAQQNLCQPQVLAQM